MGIFSHKYMFQISGLSRTFNLINLNFQDQNHFQDEFPGPGNLTTNIPALSRRRGNPGYEKTATGDDNFNCVTS